MLFVELKAATSGQATFDLFKNESIFIFMKFLNCRKSFILKYGKYASSFSAYLHLNPCIPYRIIIKTWINNFCETEKAI